MRKHVRRGIRVTIVFVLLMTVLSSVVPISAKATNALTLSKSFVMVQVGSGQTPLTASISNATWESTNDAVAHYSAAISGVIAPVEGGYAKVTAKYGNMSASCRVCSYYGESVANGTYFIKSSNSGRFLTVGSASIIQQNIGSSLQKWVVTATNDGYYTLYVSYKCSYLACNTSTTTPTLTETYNPTSEEAKWIIKKVKYGEEDQYIFMPKLLASEGYMLSINPGNNTNGGNLLLQKWDDLTHNLCGWSLHDVSDHKGTISEWRTNVSTVAYHSGDIKTYISSSITTSTPNHATLNSNFYAGYDSAESKWSDALDISIDAASLSTQTDIEIYGVTRETYQELTGSAWPISVLGTTSPALDVYKGYWFVMNTNKKISIYETSDLVTIYILVDTDAASTDAIITHELGHAVGFHQHSADPSHIMYYAATGNCAISADEAHDLKLLYDRYN